MHYSSNITLLLILLLANLAKEETLLLPLLIVIKHMRHWQHLFPPQDVRILLKAEGNVVLKHLPDLED